MEGERRRQDVGLTRGRVVVPGVDGEAVKMIASLRDCARRALILLDLERHPIAYRFLPITRRVFGWSPLTLHDGPISVAAAFRLEELVSLTGAAGASAVIGRRHRPWFRIPVVVPALAPEYSLQEIVGVEDDSTSLAIGVVSVSPTKFLE